jgi:hypothetical protein
MVDKSAIQRTFAFQQRTVKAQFKIISLLIGDRTLIYIMDFIQEQVIQ